MSDPRKFYEERHLPEAPPLVPGTPWDRDNHPDDNYDERDDGFPLDDADY